MNVFLTHKLKITLLSLLAFVSIGCSNHGQVIAQTAIKTTGSLDVTLSEPLNRRWIHGAVDCTTNTDANIEVFAYSGTSYILRQNKCISYEAPFMYLLFGSKQALLLDTGAISDSQISATYETVQAIVDRHIKKNALASMELIIVHSHQHSDHVAGDIQFTGKNHIRFLDTHHLIKNNEQTIINLGQRKITIMATAGHQEEAISLYDSQTKWLLTGDTLYPGMIYVKDWPAYKASIERLFNFSQSHEISAILGTHIEMKNQPRTMYDIGTLYQPNEAPLLLTSNHLTALHNELEQLEKNSEIIFDDFIIMPMNSLQIMISNIARWITQ